MVLARVGEENGRSVLTEEQAILIFQLASERRYSQRTIARMFQIGQRTVVDILQKKTWSYLWAEEEAG